MLGKLLALLALCPAIGFGTVGLETLMGFSFKDIFDTSKLKGTGYASHRIRIHTADDSWAGTDETVGLMFCTDHFDCTGWFDIDGNLKNSLQFNSPVPLEGKLERGQVDDEPFLAPRLQSSLGHYGDYEYLYVRMKDDPEGYKPSVRRYDDEEGPWHLHKVELQPFVEPYIYEDGHPEFYAAQEWKLDLWFGRCFPSKDMRSSDELTNNPPSNDLGCTGRPPELKYWKWGPFKRAVA